MKIRGEKKNEIDFFEEDQNYLDRRILSAERQIPEMGLWRLLYVDGGWMV